MINGIPYGLDKEGKEIYIDDAQTGAACECVCPECGEPLVAKNAGEKKKHHFAHASGTGGTFCFQSWVHTTAKEIFSEMIGQSYKMPNDNTEYIIRDVLLEKKICDVIPDIILLTDNDVIFIEIYVSHALDTAKQKKIIELDVPTVEYNLSKIDRNITKDELRDLLLADDVKVRWSYNHWEKRLYYKQVWIEKNGTPMIPSKRGIILCPMARQYIIGSTKYYQNKVTPNLCKHCVFGTSLKLNKQQYCAWKKDKLPKDFDIAAFLQEWRILDNSEINKYVESFVKKAKRNIEKTEWQRLRRR